MGRFDIAGHRPKMTGMNTSRPEILPAFAGLAAGVVLALLAPPPAVEGMAIWGERWIVSPFAQLVYLGLSCF